MNPFGGEGVYGVVHFKNLAVGVIPIDEDNNTWLVGQYRFPLDEYHWEIPEGGCPMGESPLDAAKRELAEETGLTANNWLPLLETRLSNSVSDERGYIFVARDLQPGDTSPDPTEQLQVRKLPLQEAIDLVLKGEITDSLSVMGLLRLALIQQGEKT